MSRHFVVAFYSDQNIKVVDFLKYIYCNVLKDTFLFLRNKNVAFYNVNMDTLVKFNILISGQLTCVVSK